MKTFSIINKKGGVGKTTITVNLAYLIAESCDLRVLVIDNDDQGNDSQFFAVEPQTTLADILLGRKNIQDVIQSTRYSNIDIIASGAELLDANVSVIKDEEIVQQTILKEALEQVKESYDICLIDNPPTINASVINGLVASDEVIIVTTPDMYGIRGVAQMAEYIEAIQEYNPDLCFRGCLLNKFSSTPHGFRCIEALSEVVPLLRSRIRYTKDKLEASAEEKKSIFEYSPNCGFARDLVHFFQELMAGGED